MSLDPARTLSSAEIRKLNRTDPVRADLELAELLNRLRSDLDGVLDGSVTVSSIAVSDNLASAFTIAESTREYLKVVTTNSSEAIVFGNATTNPDFTFLGSGPFAATGITTFSVTSSGAMTFITTGAGMVFDNQFATGQTRFVLGTDTNATGFGVQNNSLDYIFYIEGDGTVGICEATGELAFFGVSPVAQAAALTAADEGTVNSGDATTDGVIDNHTTRIGEIEALLTAYGLIAE